MNSSRREALYDLPASPSSLELDVPSRQLCAPGPEMPTPRPVSPPAPEEGRGSLVEVLGDMPMGLWKRLAVYPVLFWILLHFFLPCRVTGRFTLEMLGMAALGIVGLSCRLREHGLD